MNLTTKLKCYLVIVIAFFCYVNVANAEVIFSEIAWKGTSGGATYEWLELKNNGPEVNLNGWIIKDNTDQLHIVISGDNTTIPADGFYVIKRTTSDIYPYNFSASFNGGLSDSGEKLIIVGLDGSEKNIDFLGGWPNKDMTSGETMQWGGSSWGKGLPTPGSINIIDNTIEETEDTETDTENTSTSSSNSSSSSVSISKEKVIIYPFETKIISQKTVVAGLAFMIDSETYGKKKEEKNFGKFVWNFGDGMMKEEAMSSPFEYIYQYPGEYLLSLSYFDTHFSVIPEATNRMIIKVVPSQMTISSVGISGDAFVELENKSPYEINLSKWSFVSANKIFIFPEGMIVLPNKKLKISPRVTGFDISDLSYLILKNPSLEIIATYPIFLKSYTKNTTPVVSSNSNYVAVKSTSVAGPIVEENSIINLNDLGAVAVNNNLDVSNKVISTIGFIFVIILGVASIFYLNKKKLSNSDDLESQISAKDITILE